jgi:hypothetical protein
MALSFDALPLTGFFVTKHKVGENLPDVECQTIPELFLNYPNLFGMQGFCKSFQLRFDAAEIRLR